LAIGYARRRQRCSNTDSQLRFSFGGSAQTKDRAAPKVQSPPTLWSRHSQDWSSFAWLVGGYLNGNIKIDVIVFTGANKKVLAGVPQAR
jgi:hypothetical protein